MNQSKHTPGPWHLVHHRPNLFKVETNRTVICDTFGGLSGETMANARLISAAPELLRALEWIVDDWERVTERTLPDDHEAKAAIAKAKGE